MSKVFAQGIKGASLLNKLWHPIKLNTRNYLYPNLFMHFLKNLPPTVCSRLSNGITVATEEREGSHVCLGIYVHAGSRYEDPKQNGITHFFEHLAFKTTKSRQLDQILRLMSATGARFRCFTTRDMCAYYALCLSSDLPLVIDILSDCLFNNAYCEDDISAQKKIVYAEMLEHDCDPKEILFDYLHGTAFQGTGLAQTVMGTSKTLSSFSSHTVSLCMKRLFDPKRIVLAAVGAITHDQVVQLGDKFLGSLRPPTDCRETSPNLCRFTSSEVRYRDDTRPLADVAVAVEGPSLCDDDHLVMKVAASVVGAWDRSQPGGEDHGTRVARYASVDRFCHAYRSFNIAYGDTCLWGAHFLAEPMQIEDMLFTIQGEWMRLCTMITNGELIQAKKELKSKMLRKSQSAVKSCHDIGRKVLFGGFRPPLHQRLADVDAVSVADVKRACMNYLYDKSPAVAAVGPTEALPDYNRIRAGMYWLRV